MLVAKLPGSMYATHAMNAGPRKGRIRNRVRCRASSTVRRPSGSSAARVPIIARSSLAAAKSSRALGLQKAQIRQVAPATIEAEPVADEELVGNREPDIAHGQVVHEAAVRAVEQDRGGERRRAAQGERAAEVVHGQPGVDDLVDEDDVTALELGVEVLQEADSLVPAGLGASVSGQLDVVVRVVD